MASSNQYAKSSVLAYDLVSSQSSSFTHKSSQSTVYVSSDDAIEFPSNQLDLVAKERDSRYLKEKIAGFDVYFPHKPYSIQKAYMSQLLKCLKEVRNN